jgi:hypothetical protein
VHPKLAKRRFDRDLAGVTDELCEERRWKIFRQEYPVLDVGFTSTGGAQLRLLLTCEHWNDVPPSITLMSYQGEAILVLPPGHSNIFHAGPHAQTQRPFVCMRGSREYHIHESHIADVWEDLKESADFRLGEIVTQVWNGWLRSNP